MGDRVKIIQVCRGLTSAMLPSPLSSQLLSPTVSACHCGSRSASGGDGHTDHREDYSNIRLKTAHLTAEHGPL